MPDNIVTNSPSFSLSMNDPAQYAMMDRYNGVFNALEISAEAFRAAYDTPDIGPHIEKDYKGLSYLSWPFAYRYLKEHFPTIFVAFEERSLGWPVFGEPGAYILRPYLTDGCRRTPALVFPLMDRKHGSLKELDGRSISDNIQRASVKCIATFTGLGLRLYAGEDIPKEDDQKGSAKLPLQQEAPKQAARTSKAPAPAKEAADTAGTEAPAPAIEAKPFDAKSLLTELCTANPLGYESAQGSLAAGKAALETLGFVRATEVKDERTFGNVVSAMVTIWAKEQGLKITKTDMSKELDIIKAAGPSADGLAMAIKDFVAKKQ
jgi:hypothetical protein